MPLIKIKATNGRGAQTGGLTQKREIAMFGYAEAPHAFWMARGMARTTGVPLVRGVVEGWISRGELARIVTRCQTCAVEGACVTWLGAAQTPAKTPVFCANKADLDALASPDEG